MLQNSLPWILLLFFTCGCTDRQAQKLPKQASALHQKAVSEEEANNSRLEEAEALLREAIRQDPETAENHLELTRVLWDKNDQLAAARYSETLIEKFSSMPDAWILRGDILNKLHQARQAIEAYEKAIKLGADEDFYRAFGDHASFY